MHSTHRRVRRRTTVHSAPFKSPSGGQRPHRLPAAWKVTGAVTETLPMSPPSANVPDAPQTKLWGRLDRTRPMTEEHCDPVGSVGPGSARDDHAHRDGGASGVSRRGWPRNRHGTTSRGTIRRRFRPYRRGRMRLRGGASQGPAFPASSSAPSACPACHCPKVRSCPPCRRARRAPHSVSVGRRSPRQP